MASCNVDRSERNEIRVPSALGATRSSLGFMPAMGGTLAELTISQSCCGSQLRCFALAMRLLIEAEAGLPIALHGDCRTGGFELRDQRFAPLHPSA